MTYRELEREYEAHEEEWKERAKRGEAPLSCVECVCIHCGFAWSWNTDRPCGNLNCMFEE